MEHNERPTPITDAMEEEMYQLRPDQWTVDQRRIKLCRHLERNLAEAMDERDKLRDAVRNLRDVKGRHHTQIAMEQLIALLPLKTPI